jgi:hypothetical protein
VSAVVVTIPGAVWALLGGMILLGGDDQHIELGGDLSWRAGDISQWWGSGLLAVAAAFLLGAVALRRHRPAGGGSAAWSDLLVHGVVFLLVDAYRWAQHPALGGGVDRAHRVAIPWAIGLIGPAVTVPASRRGR